MDIYINGMALDMAPQDITMQSQNFRFSSPIADAWTNDFELPRTKTNDYLLGIDGLLDGNSAGKRIKASASSGAAPFDCYVQVSAVADDSVTVTVYAGDFPFELLDRKLSRLLTDDEYSILPWEFYSDSSQYSNRRASDDTDAQYFWYVSGVKYGGANFVPLHPAMALNGVMRRVADAAGVTLPTDADPYLHVLATRRLVCPQNPYQSLLWYNGGDTEADIQVSAVLGGRHVCDDYEDQGGEQGVTQVVFNRAATVAVTVMSDCTNSNDRCLVRLNGSTKIDISGIGTTMTSTFSVVAGDILDVRQARSHGDCYLGMSLYITGYEIAEDDYDIEMPAPTNVLIGTSGPNNIYRNSVYLPIHNYDLRTYDDKAWRYAYYGFGCNVADITFREFLTSLCWAYGKKIHRTAGDVTFATADDAAAIDAHIEEIRPSTDTLGRTSTIGWKNGSYGSISFDNDFLEDEVAVHTSVFYKAEEALSVGAYKMAVLPMNVPEVDDEGNVTSVKFEDLDALPLLMLESGTSFDYLTPYNVMSWLGVDALQPTEAVMLTYEDVSGLDYVYVRGRKFMVREVSRDVGTGLSEVTALLVYNYVTDIYGPIAILTAETPWETSRQAAITFDIDSPTYEDIKDGDNIRVRIYRGDYPLPMSVANIPMSSVNVGTNQYGIDSQLMPSSVNDVRLELQYYSKAEEKYLYSARKNVTLGDGSPYAEVVTAELHFRGGGEYFVTAIGGVGLDSGRASTNPGVVEFSVNDPDFADPLKKTLYTNFSKQYELQTGSVTSDYFSARAGDTVYVRVVYDGITSSTKSVVIE